MSAPWSLPGAADRLAQALGDLNAFVTPRALRRYQLDILRYGALRVPSPWTGEPLRSSGCHVSNLSVAGFGNIVIAYRFRCEQTFWLIAGMATQGFPVVEVFLPAEDRALWTWSPGYDRSRYARVHARLRGLRGAVLASDSAPPPPVLLLGHPNFAHHIWNELPALQRLSELDLRYAEGLRLRSLCQPIVPVAEAFPAWSRVLEPLGAIPALEGWQPQTMTRVGATRVTEAVRGILRGSAAARRDPAVTDALAARLADRFPVVWLSARTDARTADNQEAMIVALVAAVAGAYPRAGFVLDGFSYPDDFHDSAYGHPDGRGPGTGAALRDRLIGREREISRYLSAIRAKIAPRIPAPVVSVSGLHLSDAVAIAGLADYYVCHAGTLQHKIGWIHDVPGMVHTNRAGLTAGAARWAADQVEGGVPPTFVEPALIDDLSIVRTVRAVERNRDYRFADIRALVSCILKDMARQLPGLGEPP